MRNEIFNLFKYVGENNPYLIRSYEQEFEKGHGRIEHRKVEVISVHNTNLSFDGVKQIVLVTRYRELINSPDKLSIETVSYITNAHESELSAQQIEEIIRMHWHIENKLHYVLDNVFGEDRSTIRAGYGARVMSAMRVYALNLFRLSGIGNIKRLVDNFKLLGSVGFCEKAVIL